MAPSVTSWLAERIMSLGRGSFNKQTARSIVGRRIARESNLKEFLLGGVGSGSRWCGRHRASASARLQFPGSTPNVSSGSTLFDQGAL